mmetsp:Transcript_41620/g.98633  ORF Transcript_41620/g.98633 Transcript_41620/m.98633 type:complete len:463 (+) Transcript_41620:32-1420(+)|eukprot:CAMPEP_0177704886 /NCGR_PEP_ID=MMETSP0484_2-20121128/8422_1 /TAXON_ID=354590 /ORGANISM="Rhodomonas lens, Strain RHODO" /LENGTH=462 /DNA_ID=CAMNT_0019216293 /DNA_START=47 /DNA_END=1435 /DNA_ORIENTATION=+
MSYQQFSSSGRDGQIKADFDRQPIRNFTPADGGRQTYSYEGEGRTPIQYTGDRIQSAQYTGERVNTEPGRYDVKSTSGKRMTYTGGYLAQSEEDYHRVSHAYDGRGYNSMRYQDTSQVKMIDKPVEVTSEVIRVQPVDKYVERIEEQIVVRDRAANREVSQPQVVWQVEEVVKEVFVEREEFEEIVQEVYVDKVVEKLVEVIREVPVDKIVQRKVEVIKEVPFIRYVDKVVNKEVIVKRIQERVVEVMKEVPVEVIKKVPVYVKEDVGGNVQQGAVFRETNATGWEREDSPVRMPRSISPNTRGLTRESQERLSMVLQRESKEAQYVPTGRELRAEASYSPSYNGGRVSGVSGGNCGVGMVLQKVRDGGVMVLNVVPDGPAAASGKIVPGDYLVSVDAVDVGGWSLDRVSDKVQGPVGSQVDLLLARTSANRRFHYNVSLKRAWSRGQEQGTAEGDVSQAYM